VGQIVWSPIAQGVLAGKYRPGDEPPEGTRAASPEDSVFMRRFMEDEVLEAVQRLRPVADRAGLTMPQLALAWVLREDNVSSAIVGASRPEQVEDNAGASGVRLGEDVLRAVDEALAGAVVEG
jgi:aryl-alcohol dehydrogenase-like predicted oxidoreductase